MGGVPRKLRLPGHGHLTSLPMTPALFRHSVGVLITDSQTSPYPDEHSFRLDGDTIVELCGWGASGRVPFPNRNPPQGSVTTVHVQVEELTEPAKTALADLLSQHRDRYREARIYVADTIGAKADFSRWVSGGCQPGSPLGGWGTSESPEDREV